MIIQIFWIKQEINAKDEYLAITLISNLAFVVNCVMSYHLQKRQTANFSSFLKGTRLSLPNISALSFTVFAVVQFTV